MPTELCSWGDCKSDSRHKNHEFMKDVCFFKIPDILKDPEKHKLWIHLCGRADLELRLASTLSKVIRRSKLDFYQLSPRFKHQKRYYLTEN